MLNFLLNAIPLSFMWGYFFNEVLPIAYSKQKDYWGLTFFYFVHVFIVMGVIDYPGGPNDQPFIRMLFALLISITFLKFFKKAKLSEVLYYQFIQLLMALVCEILAMTLTMFVTNFDQSIYENLINDNLLTYMLNDLLYMLAINIFLSLRKKNCYPHKKMLLLIMICYQFMLLYLISFDMIFGQRINLMVIICYLLILVIVDIVAFRIIVRLYQGMKKEKYLIMETMVGKQMQEQFERLFTKQQVMEKIYQEIVNEDIDDVALTSYREDLKAIRNHLYCDNPAINAMIDHYWMLCNDSKIRLNVDFKGTLPIDINVYDINTLISNCLQNAYEECNGNKHSIIDLTIICKDQLMMIDCRNTLNHDHKMKKDKKISGQGLKIVKSVVDKYGGLFNFDLEDDRAKVNISLTLNAIAKESA